MQYTILAYFSYHECSDPSKLVRSSNSFSSHFLTIFYIALSKAILSRTFQFQSQRPSFICITKTNGKHISARVRLIMVPVKVFLMIQFEVVISTGRKFHLLGVLYFSSFYEKWNRENKKQFLLSDFSGWQNCCIWNRNVSLFSTQKEKHCQIK